MPAMLVVDPGEAGWKPRPLVI